MPFSDFLNMIKKIIPEGPTALTVDDFLLTEPLPSSEERSLMTKYNKLWAKEYQKKIRKKGIRVADLQQNPSARPRWGAETFPTLTTGCTKMFHVQQQKMYSQGLKFI